MTWQQIRKSSNNKKYAGSRNWEDIAFPGNLMRDCAYCNVCCRSYRRRASDSM